MTDAWDPSPRDSELIVRSEAQGRVPAYQHKGPWHAFLMMVSCIKHLTLTRSPLRPLL